MSLDTPVGVNGAPIPIVRLGSTNQQVTYAASGGASAQSAAFGANTEAIMLTLTSADQDMRIAFGTNPTASGTTALVIKNGVYYFRVRPGDKLACVANGAGTGTLTFNELQGLG